MFVWVLFFGLLSAIFFFWQTSKMADLEDEAWEIMEEYMEIEELHHMYRSSAPVMMDVLDSYPFVKRLFNVKAETVKEMYPNLLNRLDLHLMACSRV